MRDTQSAIWEPGFYLDLVAQHGFEPLPYLLPGQPVYPLSHGSPQTGPFVIGPYTYFSTYPPADCTKKTVKIETAYLKLYD